MTKVIGWASWMLFAVAVILLAFFAREIMVPARTQDFAAAANSKSDVIAGPINPASIRVDLGQIKKGSLTHFEVKLTNSSPRSARIVGTPSICVQAGCVVVEDPPAAILPEETATLHLICETRTAGPLRLETSIYFDFGDPIGVEVPVTVVAAVIDSTQTK